MRVRVSYRTVTMELDWWKLSLLQRSNSSVSLSLFQIIIKQLVEAAIEMHSKGVFHRDIKPDNVLIQDTSDGPRVRIIDFGCSCLVRNQPCSSFSGTVLLLLLFIHLVISGRWLSFTSQPVPHPLFLSVSFTYCRNLCVCTSRVFWTSDVRGRANHSMAVGGPPLHHGGWMHAIWHRWLHQQQHSNQQEAVPQ